MAHQSIPSLHGPERSWPAYLKAGLMLLPSVIFFAVAVIFVLPKIKQMCADVNYDARYLFKPIDFIADHVWAFVLVAALVLAALEHWVAIWRRYRAAFLAALIFVVHSAVLLGLFTSLVVTAIVGPAMRTHL